MTRDTAYQIPFPVLSGQVLREDRHPPPRDRLWLPLRDTPAYRAAYHPEACTTHELLAAVIRGSHGIPGAYALLDHFRGLRGISNAAQQELMQIPGIGPARAASIKAALELGRRMNLPDEHAPVVQSPEHAASLLMPKIGHLEKERLVVLLLNTRNRLIGEPVEVYNGSLNASMVRVGEVFRPALQANAAAILIAHNHPSGDVTPSPEDVALTRAFVEAGTMLDVEVLDHLIVSSNCYVSLKAKGLGFA
ncbi:MAG: DNA repair protein RadC [Chloroflexota bacterium]